MLEGYTAVWQHLRYLINKYNKQRLGGERSLLGEGDSPPETLIMFLGNLHVADCTSLTLSRVFFA